MSGNSDGGQVRERRQGHAIVNGTVSPDEQKMFSHPMAMMSHGGQHLVYHQPMVALRQGEGAPPSLQSTYVTEASLFYSPHYFLPQQVARHHFSQQATQRRSSVPPLIQVHGGASSHEFSLPQNGYTVHPGSPGHSAVTSPVHKERANSHWNGTGSVVPKPEAHKYSPPPDPIPATPVDSPPTTPGSAAMPRSPSNPGTLGQGAVSPSENEVCAICNDKATGHHYGVTSCEGCKGFFKRTVQNRKVYSCRNLTQDCPINKRHRNRCQYCRFQKCMKVGMLKEAVREDRTPGGKHKPSLPTKLKHESCAKQPRKSSSSSTSSDSTAVPTAVMSSFIKELLALDAAGSVVSGDCASCNKEDLGQRTLAHITQLAERQLCRSCGWFENFAMLADISEADKNLLIKTTWIELMLVNLTKLSMLLSNEVCLCQGQILNFSDSETAGIGDIMQRVIQLTTKFKDLGLDDAEFVCIKVIVLLNPDIKGLEGNHLIERLQDKVHSELQEYINMFHPWQPNRFGNILLRLPELRSIGTKSMERLFMLNLTGQIQTSPTLNELLRGSRK